MKKIKTKSRGVVKTVGQVKKHVTQMSPEDKVVIAQRLDVILDENLIFSSHLRDKLNAKSTLISKKLVDDIHNDIQSCIIEYNEAGNSKRVVVRSNMCMPVERNRELDYVNLCLVIDLTNSRVVTAYTNSYDDDHSSVDYSRYDKNLKVKL